MHTRYLRLILLFLTSGAALFYYLNRQQCAGLECISFTRKEKYSIRTLYEDTDKAYRTLLKSGSITVRVEKYLNTKPIQAQSNNEYKLMQLSSLYEDAKSPYPGALSDRISCDNQYKPVIRAYKSGGMDIRSYSGFLNDRMQYGGCLREQIAYSSRAVIFYCPGHKAWYHLEFINPIGESTAVLDLMARSVSCLR